MKLKENMYEVLFESIQEGLILVNSNGEIVDNNKTAEELFYYDRHELLGQKIEVLVPSSARGNHVTDRQAYSKKPEKRTMGSALKLNGQRKDGSIFAVEVSLNPLITAEKERFVVALVSDVSTRRETEEDLERLTASLELKVKERTIELKKSEQLYRSIARNFPGGVISIFDSSYKYLFAEGQGLFELGIETEDLIGLDYLERIVPEAREMVRTQLDYVFAGEYRNFEVEVGGTTYLLNAVPLSNDLGEIDRILVVEKNVTERRNMERKLESNLFKEKELNEMKSRFVSMASHEFRTPLTTINSSAGLILRHNEKNNQEKIEKHVVRIKKSVRNLTSILNDFLSLEKLESGKVNSVRSNCDLNRVINESIDDLTDVAKRNQIISYKGPDEMIIFSDEQLLKNIVLNLLSNAIKYSAEDGAIEVALKEEGECINIAVKDEGIGIPEKDQKRMFDRFFRAGNVMNIEGTGLGLNIVNRYLDLLDGEMSFISKEGVGTTFFINFPKNLQPEK
jgi:PAS domain S-box-containing protein